MSTNDSQATNFIEEYDKKGRLIRRGHYKSGVRVGVWWFYSTDGSALVGELDKYEELTGNNIAYMYPDRYTCLVGEFHDGKLKSAQGGCFRNIKDGVPEFYIYPNSVTYTSDISTSTKIAHNPLLPDPYETERVYVKKSNIDGANEGLFSKLDVKENVIVAFYNGTRMNPDEVEEREWSQNGYTMLLNNDVILDIPPQYTSLDNYCATLGHKANHSFTPNCICDNYEHPIYGPIIALQTTRPVRKDEELTINYGYGPMEMGEELDVPEWFKEQIPFYEQHEREMKLHKEAIKT